MVTGPKRTSRSFDDSSRLSDLEHDQARQGNVRDSKPSESFGRLSGISYRFSGGIGSGAGQSFLKQFTEQPVEKKQRSKVKHHDANLQVLDQQEPRRVPRSVMRERPQPRMHLVNGDDEESKTHEQSLFSDELSFDHIFKPTKRQ